MADSARDRRLGNAHKTDNCVLRGSAFNGDI